MLKIDCKLLLVPVIWNKFTIFFYFFLMSPYGTLFRGILKEFLISLIANIL